MSGCRTLDDLDVAGRRALVRVDLNVPVRAGKVADSTRIACILPTLRELSEKGARIILLSHFGRPKGRRAPEMSLAPLVGPLSTMLGRPVAFADDCIGASAAAAVEGLAPGEIVLLENTRFHAGEAANDPGFVRELARLGEVFVADAFSCAHRAHASTEGLAHVLPSAVGRCMEAELQALNAALVNPQRPAAALVGGAKVSTKIAALLNLTHKVDTLIIGGAMANTFLLARGVNIGASLAEPHLVAVAADILAEAEKVGCAIILPVDAMVAARLEVGVETASVDIGAVPDDAMMLDVGPGTVNMIVERLQQCRTLMWNGPMGAFEVPPFDTATVAIAQAAAEQTRAGGLLSFAGGGDTVAALNHAGVAGAFTYVSPAGGAFLEWIEGKTLPGLAVLEEGVPALEARA